MQYGNGIVELAHTEPLPSEICWYWWM